MTYLVQAALIRRPQRAVHEITQRGLDVLRQHPDRIDNPILEQFEEFREFKERARVSKGRDLARKSAEPASSPTSPEEVQGDPPGNHHGGG